jgi:hypothetical protein
MGISEAERRVKELTSLITNQLRLIRKLEKRGRDLTSAKIVFDSLRVSLFLATQDWHRARCFGAPDPIANDANQAHLTWGSKTSLAVVPHTERRMPRWTGKEASVKPVDELLDIADQMGTKDLKEGRDTSLVPETEVEQKNDSSKRDFGFRPLTEEEKKQFVNSLNDDGKRILAQLAGEAKAHTGESAA